MVESLRDKVVNVERGFEGVNGTWNTLRKALAAGRPLRPKAMPNLLKKIRHY